MDSPGIDICDDALSSLPQTHTQLLRLIRAVKLRRFLFGNHLVCLIKYEDVVLSARLYPTMP